MNQKQQPADPSTSMTDARLAEEIVDALKEQGYRVTKNAVGDHSCAGPVNITRLAEALRRVVVRVSMMDRFDRMENEP